MPGCVSIVRNRLEGPQLSVLLVPAHQLLHFVASAKLVGVTYERRQQAKFKILKINYRVQRNQYQQYSNCWDLPQNHTEKRIQPKYLISSLNILVSSLNTRTSSLNTKLSSLNTSVLLSREPRPRRVYSQGAHSISQSS